MEKDEPIENDCTLFQVPSGLKSIVYKVLGYMYLGGNYPILERK